MGNVYALHPPQHPIRHFVRIGHTGYRTLENLLTAGRAPIRHAVFVASYWRRSASGGGSSEKRIYLPAIDEYPYKSKVETFLRGRNSRSLVVCRDPSCCSKPVDMFNQWQSHALIQSASEIETLNSQPELKRVNHLLDSVIPEKSRNVRRIGKVELSDQALIKRLGKKSRRLELLHRTLGQITHELDTVPIARTPVSKTRPVKKVS